jgi:hypothetical protein
MTWRDVPANQLLEPAVVKEDFYSALVRARPTVDKELLKSHREWTEKYGMDGA